MMRADPGTRPVRGATVLVALSRGLWHPVAEVMLAQRGTLLLWSPVLLGLGIGLYFAAQSEPSQATLFWVGAGGIGAALIARPFGPVLGPFALAVALVAAGFVLAAARAQNVAAPVLGFRYYGPVEGRIVEVDRSSRDAVRLTLDSVRLSRMAPQRTPARVRISLYGDQDNLTAEIGTQVMLTGHLSPPAGPAEPGAFDFRRMAWFERLGAVGYTRTPVLVAAGAEPTRDLAVGRLRATLGAGLRARIGGDAGGLAAAVTTGDRSGLSLAANDAMRAANLYHIVSISGMHMGMLAAFVFGMIRYGVALVPPLALRVSAKKIAALVALPAAAFYLALAGREIPTERAFIMIAVMLMAILLGRRALTLRSVAVAALIVLVLRPESLVNAGFHMSFAAVVALTWAFRGLPLGRAGRSRAWRLALPVVSLLFSSLVAGTATAPFAAAHFNRVAHYGLLANLLAVPAMGMLLMPGAVILALLGPLGIEWPGLLLIETGARWILWVSAWVAAMPGSMSAVVRPPDAVLPMMTLGMLFVVLWRGRLRLAGLMPVALALWLWLGATRPALLVADSGALIGVMTDAGRALSKPTGDGFAAEMWLENDGDMRTQEAAAALGAGVMTSGPERVLRFKLGGLEVLQVSGTMALAALDGCDGADVLILNTALEGTRPCDVYDVLRMRDTGAVAGWLEGDRLVLRTAAEFSGSRLWTDAPYPW